MRAQFKTIRVSVKPMGCQEVFSAFLTYLQPQSFPLQPAGAASDDDDDVSRNKICFPALVYNWKICSSL